jgi:hypothetical protein
MRSFFDEKLTRSDIARLGLAGSIDAIDNAGFVDYSKQRNIKLDDASLAIENINSMRKTKPRLVLRKDLISEFLQGNNKDFNIGAGNDFESYRTWRTPIEAEYFYTKYTAKDYADSNIAFVDLSTEYYSAENNNFFNKFDIKETSKSINNDFPTVRLRYPAGAANTYNLTVQNGISGSSLTIRPKEIFVSGKPQPVSTDKAYYQWFRDLTTFSTGQYPYFQELQNITRSGQLSGFYIPYPNTLDIQEFHPYSDKVTIAPKFNQDNSQKLNGILTIAIGSANKKEIVYVSHHSYQTGFANTFENIEYTVKSKRRVNRSAKFTSLKLSSGYQSGVGLVNSGISTVYEENISRALNGKPRFLAKDYFNTGITGYVPKEIFWNGSQWIVAANGTAYSSAQDIFVNTPTKSIYTNIPTLTDIDGKYEEVDGIDRNKYGRVWVKNLSNQSWSQFNRAVIFWDKSYGLSPLYTPESGSVYVSTMAAPNSNDLRRYDGDSTGSFYYRFDKASQGNRVVNLNTSSDVFFDGWHLPFLSGATFLNSWKIPYISGETTLATGVFINSGSRIVTGTFWSGSGFTYVTGEFYDWEGKRFSGQAISGNNTVKLYDQLRNRTITTIEPGIITGFQPFYIEASNWTSQVKYITGYSGASGFSWDSGVNHNTGFVVSYNYFAPSTYSSVQGQGIPFASGAAMISGKPYISGQDYSNKPILGITGFVYVYSGEQYYTTEAVSGFYEKRAGVVFADPSGNNKIIFDTFGDYGYQNKWIFINETNPRISGVNSGYNLLFANSTQESCPAILPRAMGWQATGSISSGNIQINNIRATVSGGYVITRVPSAYTGPITDRLLNDISTDGYPYCLSSRSPSLSAYIGEPRLLLRNKIATGNSQNPYGQITPSVNAPVLTRSSGTSGAPIADWIYGSIDQSAYNSYTFGGQNHRGILLDTAASGYVSDSPLTVSRWINNQSNGFYGNIKITDANIIETDIKRVIKQPVQVKCIFLDSAYLSGGNVLPKGFNYVKYTGQVTDAVRVEYEPDLILDGGINSNIDTPIFRGYSINGQMLSDQEIAARNIPIKFRTEVLTSGAVLENFKQTTPLKDTIFYKFYNRLYNYGKTIATGTWDGTVPAGAYFSVELISTRFNESFGLSDNLGVYYAGSTSGINEKIKNVFNSYTISDYSPSINNLEPLLIKYTAYASNVSFFKSKMHAKSLARKNLNQKMNLALKNGVSELIFENSNSKRMQLFLQKNKINDAKFNTLNIPTGNILVQL